MTRAAERDVLVVGGGPTGLMAALALARRGIRSTVLEPRGEPTDVYESRAITWMPRAIEVAEAAGFRNALEEAAIRRRVHAFEGPRGQRLATVRFDELGSPYPYTLQVPQGVSEGILEEAARKSGLVELRRGLRVLSIGQDAGGVWASAAGSGGERTLHARYGLGADGARSVVRSALQIGTTRRDYGASSVVADFVGEGGIPATESVIVLDPRRPRGLFPISSYRWRLVYRLNDGEDRHDVGPVQAEQVLAHFPQAAADQWTWTSAFRLAQDHATAYRTGSWTLVGDAAHPMGPSAGAGMMLGILGAWRAAWALAQPDPVAALVDYETGQRAAARRVQASNGRIFRQMAVTSRLVGEARAGLLPVARRLVPVERRMARQESLVDEPLPEL